MTSVFHSHSEAALIERLQQQIFEVLSPLLSSHSTNVLFDFPDHDNVGDSAIFLGELAYLRRHHKLPRYISKANKCNYGLLIDQYRESLILIHGGGNFGDIWPWHQSRREDLLSRFPGRLIIQLPQTIKFESQSALYRTKEVIKRHGNFVLLVRDVRSYEFAKSEFDCRVILCPDMAFYMGLLERNAPATRDLLLLLREDREKISSAAATIDLHAKDAMIEDWTIDNKPRRVIQKLVALAESFIASPQSITSGDNFRNNYFTTLAEKRVHRGLRLLSSGRFIITDRLHAYILAVMLGIPRAVLDNSYGKISGYINTWMTGDDLARVFGDVSEALSFWESEKQT